MRQGDPDSRRLQVVDALRHVLTGKLLDALELDYELVFDYKIREVLAERKPLYVIGKETSLLTATFRDANSRSNASSYTFSRKPHPNTFATSYALPMTVSISLSGDSCSFVCIRGQSLVR